MQDSTPSRALRTSVGSVRHVALSVIVVVLVPTLGCTTALADGDPASDVLAQQSLYLPPDAGLSPTRQAQLYTLLASATSSGFPIRVALIASPSDLGSVAELWNRPQSYAKLLGLELGAIYHGPVLVLMPNGLGIVGVDLPAAVQSALAADVRSARLGSRALTAVQRLSAAAGHPLSISGPMPSRQHRSTDITAWIVFATGAVLIALAWIASLRGRPPRLTRAPSREAPDPDSLRQ